MVVLLITMSSTKRRMQWNTNIVGRLQAEGQNNHITKSLDRAGIKVINFSECSLAVLADCVLYFFFILQIDREVLLLY